MCSTSPVVAYVQGMADAKTLFMAEFGNYFEQVSPDNPVGVCARCLALRTRTEVDPQERCPVELLAGIVRGGMDKVTSADTHDWKRFIDRDELEQFVKSNVLAYKTLVAQAVKVAVIAPAVEEEQPPVT